MKLQLSATSSAAPSHALSRRDMPFPRQEEVTDVSRSPLSKATTRNDQPTDNSPTVSRTIDGLELTPRIIDDCFQL